MKYFVLIALVFAGCANMRDPIQVSYGSKADIPRHSHLRPLSGVKQTSNVRFLSPNRSCIDDVRYWG